MNRTMQLALVLAAVAAGCEKSSSAPVGRSQIVLAWTQAGLKVGELKKSEGTAVGSDDCQAGTVEGLEITLCTYPTAKDAVLAEDKGLAWVGDATGASIAQGPSLLVVVDRAKSDPTGRTIDKLTKVFRGRK